MKGNMPVLSTRKATEEEEKLAHKMGFSLVSHPLLKFEYLEPDQGELEFEKMAPDAWVFTSKNGVEGFMRIFEQGLIPLKPKKIFAVGRKTASKLKAAGFDAEVPEREHGTALANLIVDHEYIHSVVHFCGNLRRDELSEILVRNGVQVNELFVYKTIREKYQNDFPQDMQAILFYSPSAVEAFGEAFKRYSDVPSVAIGSTTAAALSQHNCQKIIEAKDASTASMLKALKEYL
ncbi:MAG: uroporphyrinogen-III synthase [Balneolales bacterium]